MHKLKRLKLLREGKLIELLRMFYVIEEHEELIKSVIDEEHPNRKAVLKTLEDLWVSDIITRVKEQADEVSENIIKSIDTIKLFKQELNRENYYLERMFKDNNPTYLDRRISSILENIDTEQVMKAISYIVNFNLVNIYDVVESDLETLVNSNITNLETIRTILSELPTTTNEPICISELKNLECAEQLDKMVAYLKLVLVNIDDIISINIMDKFINSDLEDDKLKIFLIRGYYNNSVMNEVNKIHNYVDTVLGAYSTIRNG